MEKTNCIILDDEPGPANRLKHLIEDFTEISVLSVENDPDIAIEKICKTKTKLVFLDIEMPVKSGFDVIHEIHNIGFYPVFVFVTGHNQYAIKAIREAAFDYLVKPVDVDDLRKAIDRYLAKHTTKQGKVNLPEYIIEKISEREAEIVVNICQGLQAKEIAEKLYIHKTTVDSHRQNIFKKLEVNSIPELMGLVLSK